MPTLVSPMLMYGACGLGAVGVALSLPRPNVRPFAIGVIVTAIAMGIVLAALAAAHPGQMPNLLFYVFSAIALFGAIRVITHPRPIYAALYFVLTILSSCGLYLILSAEFMAFALVIVYAGAILITYLFVIMLATEAPSERTAELMGEYDRVSRDPIMATISGFLVLGALTTMLAAGSANLQPQNTTSDAQLLAQMPKQVEQNLRDAHVLKDGEHVTSTTVNPDTKTLDSVTLTNTATQAKRTLEKKDWPADLPTEVSNTQGVAFALINAHPGGIEVAGIILLMAMLGAVILARKKVEMDQAALDELMAREHSVSRAIAGDVLGVEGPIVPPNLGEGGEA